MIRKCRADEYPKILSIINEVAQAFKGVIPADCWQEPFMSPEYFKKEIAYSVVFYGYEENGELIGIIGLQQFDYIALINHAYVLKAHQRKGIGGQLLEFVKTVNIKPLLVGTWRDAPWCLDFYQKHGFKLVNDVEKKRLLARYWIISSAHRNSMTILGDNTWFASSHSFGEKK